jgi:predicted acyltransferase
MESKGFVQPRLLSLDFFRGLTMFLLIADFTRIFRHLVSPGLEGTLIHTIGIQFQHHEWNGMYFWDLIQPFFMFIVGVAMPLSYNNRLGKDDTHTQISKHIYIRSLLLLFLGWWLYCINAGKIGFHFQNVLAQLSVTIIIAYLIMRKPATTQILISLGLLALTEVIYRTFWVEGFNQPFVPAQNFGSWFDMLIAGELSGGHWVSFNAIPTAAHTIWGVLIGQLLLSKRTNKTKLYIMIGAGLATLAIGYALDPVTPIIKRISTTSFVFASGGWTFLAFAFSFWLIDMMKAQRGVLFFAIVGMNPLFIYLFAHIGGAGLILKIINPLTNTVFGPDDLVGKLIASSVALFGLWYICYWLYKRKIFIRI